MKYCLIIDNEDQRAEIDALEYKAQGEGFPIKCYYFKPDKKECTRLEMIDGKEEYVIDLDLLRQELDKEFKGKPIDLIASDYKLDDKFLDGLGLLQDLKKNWRDKPSLVYSSVSEMIQEKLQKEVQYIIDDKDSLLKFLSSYYKNYPNDVIKRNNYIDSVISFLKTHKSPLNNKLSDELSKHGDRTFINIFPRFEGQRLEVLAKLVLKNTEESNSFEDEFIERSVAHFVLLEE